MDGDEKHLGEGEGGTYFWTLPKDLLVCPDIPEGLKIEIRMEFTGGYEATDEQQPPKIRANEVE